MTRLSESWLIVGLGNPEARYLRNRHNVGQMVLDVLAGRAGGSFVNHRQVARIAQVRIGMLPGGAPGPKAILAKSNSFMNTSGGPVKNLMQYFSISPDHLLVIHDELDIPEHELRLKLGGGENGHNGLKSISTALGTRDYARLRVGIGRPVGRQSVTDFVLADFPKATLTQWATTLEQAADAVEEVVTLGLAKDQMRLHTGN